jgi:hypothetical protein
MTKGNRVKASAMQFAILVSVIVTLLLSSFLLFTYTYSSFSIRSEQVLRNISAANKGIAYSCRADVEIKDSLSMVIEEIPVMIDKQYWGSFELIRSRAGEGNSSFEKVVLVGAKSGFERPGIYLENNNLPLVLVGKTRIEGDAYTPEDIIKPGSIAGHYYAGDKLVYGRRFQSLKKLPVVDILWKTYARNLLAYIPGGNTSVIELRDASNSFLEQSQVIYSTDKLVLREILKGNVILKSETAVEITSLSQIDQVLVIAPKVIIRKGFKGSLHVITEEIEVEDEVWLQYPSSIVVFEKDNFEADSPYSYIPRIGLGQSSLLEGNLLYFGSSSENISRNDILINEGSVVEGDVYCEGHTDLKGTVIGTLYTKFFVANQGGSLYINHIYNGQILKAGVKENMSGLLLAGEPRNVATWLY